MDIKTIECIEIDDPSEETLRLTTRWKEITKPGDYRFTQGQWKKYNPSRALRAEQKQIEVEQLWQKRNKFLWKRMENSGRETEEELERKREFHRVIKSEAKKGRNRDKQQSTQQPQEQDEIGTMSSDSGQTTAVPAINFKRYLGATSVRYIQMGTASIRQYNEEWDLEETIRQAD